ncbi:hypothetical protein ACROYT_G005122 [Oculina patagonica]
MTNRKSVDRIFYIPLGFNHSRLFQLSSRALRRRTKVSITLARALRRRTKTWPLNNGLCFSLYLEIIKQLQETIDALENCDCYDTPKSCAELYKSGKTCSGVYTIDPDGSGAFDVFCDQTTAGGGWTVFQKRLNGSVDFYRDWADYKNGFGDLNGEFWLGLDKIYRLTNSDTYKLRVDLDDWEGETKYAEYDTFAVSDEASKYELSLGSYSGTSDTDYAFHSVPFLYITFHCKTVQCINVTQYFVTHYTEVERGWKKVQIAFASLKFIANSITIIFLIVIIIVVVVTSLSSSSSLSHQTTKPLPPLPSSVNVCPSRKFMRRQKQIV